MEYTNLFNKDQFNNLKREIMHYNDFKEFDKCTVLLKESINCFPTHPGLYYILSIIYQNAKEYIKAAESFKKAVTLDNNKNEFLSLISMYFLGINDIETSYSYASKAYKLNNKDIDAILVLGRIEYIHRNYEDSLSFAVKAVEIDRNNFRAIRLISEIYIIIGADENETLDFLFKAQKLGTDDNLNLDIIKLLYLTEQYSFCLKECKKTLLNHSGGYEAIKVNNIVNDIKNKHMLKSEIKDFKNEEVPLINRITDSKNTNYSKENPIVNSIDKTIKHIENDKKNVNNEDSSKTINPKNQPIKKHAKDNSKIEEKETSRNSSSLDDALSKINTLVGLDNVKDQINKIVKLVKYEKNRCEILRIDKEQLKSYHFAFLGNPGTGKTTVARLVGDIFYYLGILEKGHLVEVDRSDIVGKYIGETAKLTKKAIDKAMGGILFIDEAYTLAKGGKDSNDYGKEAIETLIKAMEDNRGKFTVILAGYNKEMRNLMKLNKGLESRINLKIEFEDYSEKELLSIAENMAESNNYKLTEEGKRSFLEKIKIEQINESFANARSVRNVLEEAVREKAFRIGDSAKDREELTTLTSKDFGIDLNFTARDKINDLKNEINNLVGLKEVKEMINNILNTLEFQHKKKEMGINYSDICLNMIFTGNPGTGKTTVARIMSKILKNMGILKKGHIVEVTRSDLVGEYVGQTAPKTLEKIKEAYGGILFIDEAYSLNGRTENDFGKEALATLIKEMEDNRDKFIVIMAGYTKEMKELVNLNPGLESRIKFNINFKDYDSCELIKIFKILCKKEGYSISKNAYKKLNEVFDAMVIHKNRNFGNGRSVRKLFENIKMKQAGRIINEHICDKKEMLKITAKDI